LGAGIALHELFCGDPNTLEIFVCSTDRDQARQLFDTAKLIVVNDSDLRSRSEILKNMIKYPKRDWFFKVISSEAGTKHGANLSCFIADELHAIPGRELIDVLHPTSCFQKNNLMISAV
jgi:phage terminase large subunit-like protein